MAAVALPSAAAAKPREIAYTAPDATGGSDIWAIRPDGKGRRHLTRGPGDDHAPSWSPHHHNVVFARYPVASNPGISRDAGLYRVRADGTGLRKILDVHSPDSGAGDPVWSPDGHRILFVYGSRKGAALATISPNGKHFHRITPYGDYQHPSWSPDGKRIVFKVGRGIARSRADGTHRRLLAKAGWDPDWSPDGKRIVFYGRRHNKNENPTEIITMHTDGTHHVRITRTRPELLCSNDFECVRQDFDPAWGPGGRHVVFVESSYETYRHPPKLIVARRDGSHARVIARVAALDPEW